MTAINRHLSGRKFFMHPAHTTIGVSASLAAMRAQRDDDVFAEERAESPLRVCVIAGAPLDGSDQSLAELHAYLEERYPVRCITAFCTADEDLADFENLERADCAVIYARRLMLGGEQLRRIQTYCHRGGPLVALRTGGHTFQNWPEFEREVLGSDYQGGYSDEPADVRIVASAAGHPVVRGVEPFTSRGGLCKNVELANDATVLLRGTMGEQTHPIAWVRSHRGRRVFSTALGHPDDFKITAFLRLLVNGLAWVTRQRWEGPRADDR